MDLYSEHPAITRASPRLQLQVAPRFIGIEIIGERALDVPRPCITALDQVQVVAVHHAHCRCETGRCSRMQPGTLPPRGRRDFSEEIQQRAARLLEKAGLDARDRFGLSANLPIS